MIYSVIGLVLFSFSSLFSIEWSYLKSEAFQMRYVLAADFMSDMDYVVEIGGYETPIVDFLPEHIGAVSIDPKSTAREFGNKKVVSDLFTDKSNLTIEGSYGVVILGLHLKGMSENDWGELIKLIQNASKLVIGYPISWKPSRRQHAKIMEQINFTLTKKVMMDLRGNDFGDLSDSYTPRARRLQLYYSK